MSDMVDACPECDTPNPYKRRGSDYACTRQDDKMYYCHDCGETFDDPNRRESRADRDMDRKGLAAKLVKMDPEGSA